MRRAAPCARSRCPPLGAVALLLGASVAAGPSFRLHEARVGVELLDGQRCRVEQHMKIGASEPMAEFAVVHTLALAEEQSLLDLRGEGRDAALEINQSQAGALRTLTVIGRAAASRQRFEYVLSYEVRGANGSSCPLAVAQAAPLDPHRSVSIAVKLPPGAEATGRPFPNLGEAADGLRATLGAIPAFVRVPAGERGLAASASTHGADFLALGLIVLATVWWRMRRKG